MTGAGDIIAVALALAPVAGSGIASAARLPCTAARVAKPGTATCSAVELRAALEWPVVRPWPAVLRLAGEAAAFGWAARAAHRLQQWLL